jgi:hypothetical protein
MTRLPLILNCTLLPAHTPASPVQWANRVARRIARRSDTLKWNEELT